MHGDFLDDPLLKGESDDNDTCEIRQTMCEVPIHGDDRGDEDNRGGIQGSALLEAHPSVRS